ncbi:hypothetical protein OU798_01205 [Prolixibacteraceae bacterium Z1-6]|uniref:Uncharacterized protein n=1 Tax=Draconibacterium aestuarii TaxID=2998507 RepID=A0A9X3F215_9BACT|nr:hypothetical protein [Prolixibacteraceae bacterium Z1-6]
MKALKSNLFPFVILLGFAIPFLIFQSCDPDDCDDEDVPCDTCVVVYKPNIYIYPEQEMYLDLQISFPKGGEIIASIPEYVGGWEVIVTADGKINGEYDFLFYESEQPDVWQAQKGWCIKNENLTDFFTQNLTLYGFEGNEIDDFIGYWIPRLVNGNYCHIYPQTNQIINSVIKLTFSETPDNILRLFYMIQESDRNILLEAPEINAFKREGFFVAEWGVILR